MWSHVYTNSLGNGFSEKKSSLLYFSRFVFFYGFLLLQWFSVSSRLFLLSYVVSIYLNRRRVPTVELSYFSTEFEYH